MKLRAWLQAARPLAQVNIAMPLLVGELLAFAVTGRWSWTLFGLTHVAGLLDHLFIVFANDVADEDGDRDNTTYNAFSGGSRVLAEGKLTTTALRYASALMVVLLVAAAAVPSFALSRPLLLPAWVAGIAVLWAYSYPPLHLSYRGQGPIAQGVGLGVVLPLIGFYAIAGTLDAFPWASLAPLFVLGFAGNINTSLPDEPSDRTCNKQTWPVRLGGRRARKHSLQFFALAIALTPVIIPLAPKWLWACVQVGPALLLLWNMRGLDTAEPGNHAKCSQFVFLNGAALNLLMAGWVLALYLGLTDVP